jgi:hypothetical protein
MNAFLLILIGLVIGLALNGCLIYYFLRRLDAKWSRLVADIDLSQTYLDLDHLRSGKVDVVINWNEHRLNAAVIGLARQLRTITPRRRRSDDVYWLRKVREYRAKFPYTAGIDIDAGVVEAFVLLDGWPNTTLEPTATAP